MLNLLFSLSAIVSILVMTIIVYGISIGEFQRAWQQARLIAQIQLVPVRTRKRARGASVWMLEERLTLRAFMIEFFTTPYTVMTVEGRQIFYKPREDRSIFG